MRLSMILPAYNVADYIDDCLESITTQDIPASEYEIIVVNDGSTDDTLQHIENFAKKYSNIKIINQKNKGQAAARNRGLEIASGEYLWFIDSDDSICPNCIGGLLDACDRLRTDMFCVGPSIPFTTEFPIDFLERIDDYVSDVYLGGVKYLRLRHCGNVVWGYIIRREIIAINDLKILEVPYEDGEYMTRVFYYANRFCELNKFSVYNYVQREGSIMHSLPGWKEVSSFPVAIKSLNSFANKVTDVTYKRYVYDVSTRAYIYGLKIFIRNSKLMLRLDEYLAGVKDAGGLRIVSTSVKQRMYQYIAVHFPKLFLKIIKLFNSIR